MNASLVNFQSQLWNFVSQVWLTEMEDYVDTLVVAWFSLIISSFEIGWNRFDLINWEVFEIGLWPPEMKKCKPGVISSSPEVN